MQHNESRSYSYYIKQFRQVRGEAKDFLEPLDYRLFIRRPAAKSWCVGECFSHLVEAGNRYYDKIEEGLEHTRHFVTGSEQPMKLRFYMRWFVHYLEPPVSLKTKAPGIFQPIAYAGLDKDEILNQFLDLQDRYIKKLEVAQIDQVDLSRIKVPNPVISFIKMSVAEGIAITEAHQRRHIGQAKKTLAML